MRQARTQQAPPAPPALPGVSPTDMLTLRREEIRDQLRELSGRRNELQEQRAGVSAAKGADLDARIVVIDQRSAQLEQELFAANDMITRGLTSSGTGTLAPDVMADAARAAATNAVRETAVMTTLSLVALFAVWQGLRRFFRSGQRPAVAQDNSPQLAHLQQSMDAIAVEVERISEAQRYTAKLMNERGLGTGNAQPVADIRTAVDKNPVAL